MELERSKRYLGDPVIQASHFIHKKHKPKRGHIIHLALVIGYISGKANEWSMGFSPTQPPLSRHRSFFLDSGSGTQGDPTLRIILCCLRALLLAWPLGPSSSPSAPAHVVAHRDRLLLVPVLLP